MSCATEASSTRALLGGAEIGPTRRGKGVKILAIVDRHGLPLSVSTHAANHYEVTLVQLSFDFYMLESKPENLIGDKAYDSNALDESLKQQGVDMIAPHPSNQQLRRIRRHRFQRSPKPCTRLRVTGLDRPGVAAELTQKLAHAGINLRGFSASVVGSQFVAYAAVASRDQANEALEILNKA